MSTDYTLAKVGPVEFFACERSGQIEFGISREDRPERENYLDTDALFNDDDLLDIIIKLLAVTSYVSEDPESVVARLLVKIDNDNYLQSMPKVIR